MITLSSPERQKPNLGSALTPANPLGRLFLSLLSRKTVALDQMSRAVFMDHTHVSFTLALPLQADWSISSGGARGGGVSHFLKRERWQCFLAPPARKRMGVIIHR